MNYLPAIKNILQESIDVKQALLNDEHQLAIIAQAVEAIVQAYENNKKVLLCGNGGSAADAQHIAAELSGRFYLNRRPLFAEALHVNTSYITATANDYGYEHIYSRLLEAMGNEGDILIALSTSGNSENILNAIQAATQKNMIVIGFTGSEGGKMQQHCNLVLNIPSKVTPRIQEAHITVGHIICELVEKTLFGTTA
jgi:D-sedoheptulose 7-phosphate isomerase